MGWVVSKAVCEEKSFITEQYDIDTKYIPCLQNEELKAKIRKTNSVFNIDSVEIPKIIDQKADITEIEVENRIINKPVKIDVVNSDLNEVIKIQAKLKDRLEESTKSVQQKLRINNKKEIKENCGNNSLLRSKALINTTSSNWLKSRDFNSKIIHTPKNFNKPILRRNTNKRLPPIDKEKPNKPLYQKSIPNRKSTTKNLANSVDTRLKSPFVLKEEDKKLNGPILDQEDEDENIDQTLTGSIKESELIEENISKDVNSGKITFFLIKRHGNFGKFLLGRLNDFLDDSNCKYNRNFPLPCNAKDIEYNLEFKSPKKHQIKLKSKLPKLIVTDKLPKTYQIMDPEELRFPQIKSAASSSTFIKKSPNCKNNKLTDDFNEVYNPLDLSEEFQDDQDCYDNLTDNLLNDDFILDRTDLIFNSRNSLINFNHLQDEENAVSRLANSLLDNIFKSCNFHN